jgi:hypothetical protein
MNCLSDCTSRHWMDHFEWRVALTFLFLKGLRCKASQTELSSVFGAKAYRLSQAKRWIRRFKDGDLSCEDDDRSARPFPDLSDGISRHLDKFRFTSAKGLWSTFGRLYLRLTESQNCPGTLKLLQKMGSSWSDWRSKRLRRDISEGLLIVLRKDESTGFSHVATGDQSWF